MCKQDLICDIAETLNGLDWSNIDVPAIILAAMFARDPRIDGEGESEAAILDSMDRPTARARLLLCDLEYVENLSDARYWELLGAAGRI